MYRKRMSRKQIATMFAKWENQAMLAIVRLSLVKGLKAKDSHGDILHVEREKNLLL